MKVSEPRSARATQAARLRDAFQQVVRRSGALDPGRTACGLPLPPSHAHALLVLAREREVALSQVELARALGMDKSGITRLCERMVASGHLERTRDPGNARFMRLALTAKGQRAASTVDRASLERHLRVLAALPRATRAKVIAALELLATAMAEASAGGER